MKYIKLNEYNKIYLLPFLSKRFIFFLKTDFYNYLFLTVILNITLNFYLVINKKFGYFLLLKNLDYKKFSIILRKFLFSEKKELLFFYIFNKNRKFMQKYTQLVFLNLINTKNVKNIIK
jgi:hypothetical protein